MLVIVPTAKAESLHCRSPYQLLFKTRISLGNLNGSLEVTLILLAEFSGYFLLAHGQHMAPPERLVLELLQVIYPTLPNAIG